VKKKTLTRKDMDLEPDPVWIQDGTSLVPTPFFSKWWKEYAKNKYGNESRWLDAALELGYVAKYADSDSGQIYLDSSGLGYDASLARVTLSIPPQEPVVLWDFKPCLEETERLTSVRNWLFRGRT
jgi:hypothetical protein